MYFSKKQLYQKFLRIAVRLKKVTVRGYKPKKISLDLQLDEALSSSPENINIQFVIFL